MLYKIGHYYTRRKLLEVFPVEIIQSYTSVLVYRGVFINNKNAGKCYKVLFFFKLKT